MAKRLIHEKQGLPIPATKGLPVESSKETPAVFTTALFTTELDPLPDSSSQKRTWLLVWILAAIAAFVIAVHANAINLKDCLIGLAAVITLTPVLRGRRNR